MSRLRAAPCAALLALFPMLVEARPDDRDLELQADPPIAEVPEAAQEREAQRTGDSQTPKSRDPDAYSIVSAVRGLSLHRPMYLYPLSYSEDYNGSESEALFQISVKLRLIEIFNHNLYAAYTQRSFWQMYNRDQSSPFRETNYSPELFWRWSPREPRRFNYWGADLGVEHMSNGQLVPRSRSWNRIYVAPWHAKGRTLAYLKFWWRIPEERKTDPLDPKGDDNPDITDFYGYSELQFSRQLGNDQLLTAMLRGNIHTGHGAYSLTWSIPSADGSLFYGVNLFNGYGESLIDYDRSITRLSVGVLLSR